MRRQHPLLRRVSPALLAGILLCIPACHDSSRPERQYAPAGALRLAVNPDTLWLAGPGDAEPLQVHEILEDGSRIATSADFTSLDPAVCTVSAQGTVSAHADGHTTVTVSAKGVPDVTVTVTVAPDLLVPSSYRQGPLYAVRSTTLEARATAAPAGGDFGIADIKPYGDYIYIVESEMTADYLRVLDRADLSEIARLPLTTSLRYAQEIAFVSPTRAYIPLQLADGGGDEHILILDPSVPAVTGQITVPDPTGEGLWMSGCALWRDRLFVTGVPFDAGSWSYKPCTVTVIDVVTEAAIDVDLGTPGYQLIDLPNVNPRRITVDPGGGIVVACAGNGAPPGLVPGSILEIDPLTFALTAEHPLGVEGNAGAPMALLPDGLLVVPDQYNPFVHTFDTASGVLLRDHAHALTFGPAYHLGFSGAVHAGDGRVVVTSADGLLAAWDREHDDNGASPAVVPLVEAEVPGMELGQPVSVRPEPEPVFVDTVVVGETSGLPPGADATLALGPPEGGGREVASADIVPLGTGTLVLSFADYRAADGPGADLVVFGAATVNNGSGAGGHSFDWTIGGGTLAASTDGVTWYEWAPHSDPAFPVSDPRRFVANMFDVHPVFASSASGIPASSWAAGGDRFDLAEVGLDWCKYLRFRGDGARVDAVAARYPHTD